MSDVISGLRQVIQDLVAPDLKAHTVKLDILQKQMEMFHAALEKQGEQFQTALQKQGAQFQAALLKQGEQFQASLQRHTETLQKQSEIQYDVLLKTVDAFRAEMRTDIALLRAGNQIEVYRQLAPLTERVAVLEERVR